MCSIDVRPKMRAPAQMLSGTPKGARRFSVNTPVSLPESGKTLTAFKSYEQIHQTPSTA